MKKKIKKFGFGLISLFSLSFGLSSFAFLNNNNTNNSITTKSELNADQSDLYPLNASQSNGQNSFLSTKTGPLVFWNNTITSLDWFGAKRWTIDMGQYVKVNTNGGSWRRAWYNWDYDRTRNILWVLGYGFAQNTPQKVFSFNADNGSLIKEYSITVENTDYRFISALSSGNVLVYGGAAQPTYNGQAILVDTKQGIAKKISGDSGNIKKPDHNPSTSKMYLFNIIPIADGKNIVEYVNSDSGNGTNGDGSASRASYNVYFTLVDDELNMITSSESNMWHESVKIVDGVPGYRNTTITPQRDYYFLLDGRVVTIIYNTVVIINPNDRSASAHSNVSVQKFSLNEKMWVLSWTFDTNENLFFKYKDDGKVYRVKAAELTNGSNNLNISSQVSPTTYYDASSGKGDISTYANNFVLYNVYGYAGQIVLINSYYSDYINNGIMPNETEQKAKQYGLAIAVTQNKNDENSGDSKGFLNGPDSFQGAADFSVNEQSLKSKLPSELTRNDITISNQGFLTQNTELDTNGNKKYVPFNITEINDATGTFKITVNVDQIPWFASTLPKDSVPKTITKEYKNGTVAQKIETKISWKDEKSLSYDFKNTIPSKISTVDLNDFDPFQVSFNSRTVLSSSGEVLYPKKTYSVASHNDTDGKVTVKVVYDYMPASNEINTPLKYTGTKEYQVFKSSDTKGFYFAGATDAASDSSKTDINIQSVPQLKSLSESNLLPSSFSADNKNAFLQFINTNKSTGYPISKMNFSVTPNDTEGTLVVTATVDRSYDSAGTTFVQKFTGFNKKQNYSFKFKQEVTAIGNKRFEEILASSVNEGDVIDNLIEYQGFNSSDFEIKLSPNDDNGSLFVQINLNKNYVSDLGNSNGFSNYTASYQFNGFMTSSDYNNQYNIEFVNDNDKALSELKKLTLDNIKSSLEKGSLVIDGKTYTNLNDLIENLFIKSKGSKIPSDWKEKTGDNQIKSTMSIDNQAGTMNLSIVIDNSLLDGYGSNLNYVISYSGFAKGNAVVTADNLSFVSQDQLFNEVEELRDMTPSEMKTWLESEKNIERILFNVTGQYETLLASNSYELLIDTNDTYGTISITIKFEGVTNDQSLSEYSIQYKLN